MTTAAWFFAGLACLFFLAFWAKTILLSRVRRRMNAWQNIHRLLEKVLATRKPFDLPAEQGYHTADQVGQSQVVRNMNSAIKQFQHNERRKTFVQ